MKIAALILTFINTLPFFVYPFAILPPSQVLRYGGGESLSTFLVYGTAWGTLLYPLILAYNHLGTFRAIKSENLKQALVNQLLTSVYLLLLTNYYIFS